ncbi:MAG: restriction endonuclease subunit S [Ruminococcus sp.]|nr:restriction endonuclease subunit S [Ruminococcus sp.]
MGIWKECLLGDIVTFSNGKKRLKQMGNIPVYGGNGILDYTSQSNYENCVIVGRVGAYCGSVFYEKNKCWVSDNAIAVLPKNNNDIQFIYYLLKTLHLNKRHIGTGQPLLTQGILNGIELYMPDIKIQNQISSVLSAYDDLIENNQRQIQLLEEIAQRLYKEWFVDLHFPNYESTPIVDGVPEGWRIGQLEELGEFKRGKTITKDSVIVGNVPVVAGGLEPAYYHNTANTTAPVVTVSGSGANAGFTRMYHVNVWASDCSFIDINSTNYPYQIYCYLKANKADLNRLQKGSAQPHVYARDINAMKCLIPDKKIAIHFNTFVSPIFSKIGNLYQQIESLKEARDRLLPKLINGEIDVSEVRI